MAVLDIILSGAIIIAIAFVIIASMRRVTYQQQWLEIVAMLNLGPNRV